MTQLLKHYYLNRNNGEWATNTRFGLMMPKIDHLEIQYTLEDENNIPFMLSHVPDVIEKTISVGYQQYDLCRIEISDDEEISEEESQRRRVQVWLSENNIVGIETTRIEYEEPIFDENGNTTETISRVLYDVTYNDPYVLTESVGLTTLSQAQWDSEISAYDARQQNKRYDVLRVNRDKMLKHTDWMVIKSKETGTNLTTAFKTWRQELRELPNSVGFPTAYPTLPSSLESDSQLQELTSNFDEVRSFQMINDPLPPLPEPELPGE